LGLRHTNRAFVQRHAGGGRVRAAPMLMIDAVEGLSLQNAAFCIALRPNGDLKSC